VAGRLRRAGATGLLTLWADSGFWSAAETILGADRLIACRTRLVDPQASLWPDWRYHALVTDRAGRQAAVSFVDLVKQTDDHELAVAESM
jgi:hypothetical protein